MNRKRPLAYILREDDDDNLFLHFTYKDVFKTSY